MFKLFIQKTLFFDKKSITRNRIHMHKLTKKYSTINKGLYSRHILVVKNT